MTPRNPYRAAGTFVGDAYVEREADRRLQKELLDNQRYPFFCAPRQNGKSSLIANTMQRLPSAQFRTVLIDLSPFDVSDYMAFMGDFLESIARQLGFPAAAHPAQISRRYLHHLAHRDRAEPGGVRR